MSSEVRIAVSGKSGCGNTTVSRLLAERLGIRLINYTFHDMAKERGISFEQLCLLAENDSQYDRYLDRRQVELALEGSCVLASRLAIWLLEQADLKVYLYASANVRARRISQREGTQWEQSLKDIQVRDSRDQNRYQKLYGMDIDNYDFANLVVNTEQGDQFYVVDKIVEALEGNKLYS
jgi:cytidylate kinase